MVFVEINIFHKAFVVVVFPNALRFLGLSISQCRVECYKHEIILIKAHTVSIPGHCLLLIPSYIGVSKCIWAMTWQNQQNECAPSEDSDQPGHPPSLIRIFAVRMKKPWALTVSYPLSAQWRLIRLGGCPGWSVFAGRTHMLVLSCRCPFTKLVRTTKDNDYVGLKIQQPASIYR